MATMTVWLGLCMHVYAGEDVLIPWGSEFVSRFLTEHYEDFRGCYCSSKWMTLRPPITAVCPRSQRQACFLVFLMERKFNGKETDGSILKRPNSSICPYLNYDFVEDPFVTTGHSLPWIDTGQQEQFSGPRNR